MCINESLAFGVSVAFRECTDPNKLNLGVGAYRTEELKPYVLECVKQAEKQMLEVGLGLYRVAIDWGGCLFAYSVPVMCCALRLRNVRVSNISWFPNLLLKWVYLRPLQQGWLR